MRLMYRKDGKWIQLFIDSALDRYKNLSDLEDIEAAKDNLKLDQDYWSKEELLEGEQESIIHNICIIQDENARFVTDEQIAAWDNKVDRPIVSSTEPENMTEGQFWYDPSTDSIKVFIDGEIRDTENVRHKFGTSNFAGSNSEKTIAHGCLDSKGKKVIPKFVEIIPNSNPNGTIGEVWVRQDNTNIYVGNTGSFTGRFQYMITY